MHYFGTDFLKAFQIERKMMILIAIATVLTSFQAATGNPYERR